SARLSVQSFAGGDPEEADLRRCLVGGPHQLQLTGGRRLPRLHPQLRRVGILLAAARLGPFAGVHPIALVFSARRHSHGVYDYQIPTIFHHRGPTPSHITSFTSEIKNPTRHHSPCVT